MSERVFCCQKCSKLYLGTAPEVCPPPCGGTIRQGLEALSFDAKKELAEIRRKQDNEAVKRQLRLKPKKGK